MKAEMIVIGAQDGLNADRLHPERHAKESRGHGDCVGRPLSFTFSAIRGDGGQSDREFRVKQTSTEVVKQDPCRRIHVQAVVEPIPCLLFRCLGLSLLPEP